MKPQKQMRVIQTCFVVYAVLLIGLAYRLPAHTAQKPSLTFQIILGFFAVSCGFYGFRLQRIMTRAQNRAMQSKSSATLLKRWRVGHILRFAFHVSILLYGLVLHMLGGATWLVDTLFAGGMVLLLTWKPGTIPSEAPDVDPINS